MAKYIIGLDIGATKIAAGVLDGKGKVVEKITLPTETNRGKKIILKNILTAASKVWLPGVQTIGVGMAGQCDFRRGVFVSGPNFPKNFKNIDIRKFLKKNFRVPVYLDNDARCFTIAEATFGAGLSFKNIIGITLGTGIGGGIVIDKKILRGRNNLAGEIGHITIEASSPHRCGCGKFGHFEALASGSAMQNFYKKLTNKTLNAFQIKEKFLAGDKNAKKVFSMVSKYLALGLATFTQILNPDVIIIGGGISNISALWPLALHNFKKEVTYKSLKNTPIVKAALGDEAGIIGAALLTGKLEN